MRIDQLIFPVLPETQQEPLSPQIPEQRDHKISVSPHFFLCIFIRIPDFPLANSSQLVARFACWFKVNFTNTVSGCHSVITYPVTCVNLHHNIFHCQCFFSLSSHGIYLKSLLLSCLWTDFAHWIYVYYCFVSFWDSSLWSQGCPSSTSGRWCPIPLCPWGIFVPPYRLNLSLFLFLSFSCVNWILLLLTKNFATFFFQNGFVLSYLKNSICSLYCFPWALVAKATTNQPYDLSTRKTTSHCFECWGRQEADVPTRRLYSGMSFLSLWVTTTFLCAHLPSPLCMIS